MQRRASPKARRSRGFLLSKGNEKLGDSIFTFSIPAVSTCPGRTSVCESKCYATRSRFCTKVVIANLARCLEASKQRDFVARMAWEIEARQAETVRLHSSGDLFSAGYARKWLQVIQRCPDVQFYTYTRSWRVPKILPVIEDLSRQPNMRLWYSADSASGIPINVPPGVRIAWLMTSPNDLPPANADLVFLDYKLRRRGTHFFGPAGVLGCPAETSRTTCEKCRLCLGPLKKFDPRQYKRSPGAPGRISLPIVA